MLYRKKEMHDGWVFRRGDIYLANLNPFRGSEQEGHQAGSCSSEQCRQFICTDADYRAGITSQLHKLGQPTHYLIRKRGRPFPGFHGGVGADPDDRQEPGRVLYRQNQQETMKKIDEVITVSLGMEVIEDVEAP